VRPAKSLEARGAPLPTEESWTAAQMVPSERTIPRRFGSFRSAATAAGIESVQITSD
jgi:hypothetical protein